MDDEMFQSNALVFVLFGGLVSFGCSGSNPEPNNASGVSSASNLECGITTGHGAAESTDALPEARILA